MFSSTLSSRVEKPELRRSATSLALVDPVTETKYLFEATPNLPEQLYKLETIASDTNYSLEGVFLRMHIWAITRGSCTSASNL